MIKRVSLSIPEELKQRMDRAEEAVNWSRVAAIAFEKKLAELSAKKEEQTMDDVIQRLKASKLESEEEDYQEGYEVGKDWAKDSAEWKELQRLKAIREDRDFVATLRHEGSNAAGFFLKVIDPEENLSFKEFWEDLSPGEIPSEGYIRGLWDGAVEVFRDVESKIGG